MIFNDYHSYIASILNKKLIINRINDVKVLLANTSTLICCSYMHPLKFMFEQHFSVSKPFIYVLPNQTHKLL